MKGHDDPFSLTIHGYVHGLLRVRGDDSEPSQTLRWIIVDKDERWWDIFKVIEPNTKDKWLSREIDELEKPTDLKHDWEVAFRECTAATAAA